MRTKIRGFGFGAAILALSLVACSPPAPQHDEASTPPTNEEREAAIAAQQLAALGGPADAATQAN